MTVHALRTVAAVRYVTPLRVGKSLPASVEDDDARRYVLPVHTGRCAEATLDHLERTMVRVRGHS